MRMIFAISDTPLSPQLMVSFPHPSVFNGAQAKMMR
jgi:hypothetical protein